MKLNLRIVDRRDGVRLPEVLVALEVGQVLAIGRELTADVVLPAPTVSRRHCEIRRDEAGVRLTDRKSLNGTRLNDVPVGSDLPIYLRPCDTVQVADFEIRLEGAASVAPAWRTWNGGTVPRIAAAVRQARHFGDLPVLHDALLDAGCDNADVLDHLRAHHPAVRGCWVLDLLLGREPLEPATRRVFDDSDRILAGPPEEWNRTDALSGVLRIHLAGWPEATSLNSVQEEFEIRAILSASDEPRETD